MKKGFLYYSIVASLVLHFLLVLIVRLETPENKKEKEPIAIDIIGPLNRGEATRLPTPPKQARTGTITPKPSEHAREAQSVRPSFPAIPIPATAPSEMAKAQPASPPAPAPSAQGLPMPGATKAPAAPSARSNQHPAAHGQEGSEKLVRPTLEDLRRYAKLDDRDLEKSKKNEITLDDEDLKYASYLQGLKNRIELIWKYPETARRDGLQGDLVMKFSIAKSGRVENIELVKSSGYPMLDDAAKQALHDASPFNPLPDQWHQDYFTITGTFVYRLIGGLDLR